MTSNDGLVTYLQTIADPLYPHRRGGPRLYEAMRAVDRKDFLPTEAKVTAYCDEPVPIGYGQTCSQPSMVAIMLAELDIMPGHRILEIGSGCGYAAAIASILCAPGGKVFACEIIPELAALLRGNIGARFENIALLEGDGSLGFPDLGPFDRILLSAGVDSSRFDRGILTDQLAPGGIMVYPEMAGRLFTIERTRGGLRESSWYGVSFVPLRGANS